MSENKSWWSRLVNGRPEPTTDPRAPTWARAFDDALLEGLGDAIATLRVAYPSRVAERLEAQVTTRNWHPARSAVGGLREDGPGALASAPVIAAWVAIGAPICPDDYAGYGLREAVITLADLQLALQNKRTSPPDEDTRHALERMARFFEECVEPMLCALLVGPRARVQRGVINYLRRCEVSNLDAIIDALERHVDSSTPPTNDGDYAHGYTDALKVLQTLDARQRAERATPTSRAATSTAGSATSARPLWEDVFGEELTDGLDASLERARQLFESRTRARLEAQLQLTDWTRTRAAISGLRSSGDVALPSAPLVAAWVILAAPLCPDDYAAYTVREGLSLSSSTHSNLTRQLAQQPDGSQRAALEHILTILTDGLEPALIELLSPPWVRMHRGIISYFRQIPPQDPEHVIEALEALIDSPLPRDSDADFEYSHSEALTLLQRLDNQLRDAREQERRSRGEPTRAELQAQNNTNASAPPRPATTYEEEHDEEHDEADEFQDWYDGMTYREVLFEMANSDQDASVRASAIETIASYSWMATQMHARVFDFIEDPDPRVRAAAARLLGALADDHE